MSVTVALIKKRSRAGFTVSLAVLMLTAGMLISGCQHNKKTKAFASGEAAEDGLHNVVYYTCAMHPQVHENRPGRCPICGMKLLRAGASGKKDGRSVDSALTYLVRPATETVTGSFKVITPAPAAPVDTISVTGYIGFDKRGVHQVTSRVAGRIDKLYVKHGNEEVRKGQPLMTIYSPELLSVQKDLLQVVKNKDTALVTFLKQKLSHLGMRAKSIRKVLQRRQPLTRVTLFSPYNGLLRPDGESDGISVSLPVSEGMYVRAGQRLFAIQNTDTAWAVLQVLADNAALIKPGDPVKLYADGYPENVLWGHVDFIPPYREKAKKTTMIRVYLSSRPDSWKIGTLIHGALAVNAGNKNLFVPLAAVNRLGRHHVVWVQDKKNKNMFHVRQVKTGLQIGDSIALVSGIQPGDKIVADASYMVGSDSFVP